LSAIKFVLREALGESQVLLPRLRIIKIPTAPVFSTDNFPHELYFEIITRTGSFICSGCTDYAGWQTNTSKILTKLFEAISLTCGIKIEEHVTEHGIGDDIDNFLSKTWESNPRHLRQEK